MMKGLFKKKARCKFTLQCDLPGEKDKLSDKIDRDSEYQCFNNQTIRDFWYIFNVFSEISRIQS